MFGEQTLAQLRRGCRLARSVFTVSARRGVEKVTVAPGRVLSPSGEERVLLPFSGLSRVSVGLAGAITARKLRGVGKDGQRERERERQRQRQRQRQRDRERQRQRERETERERERGDVLADSRCQSPAHTPYCLSVSGLASPARAGKRVMQGLTSNAWEGSLVQRS